MTLAEPQVQRPPLADWISENNIKVHHIAVVGLIIFTSFTHFWRLGTPDRCYFDEVYFPTTGAEILRGDNNAWEFFGHENTHPPLSKVLMAAGMGIFGHNDGTDNGCWGDAEDEARRTDRAWLYDPFGWRFPGALAGVGGVIFMYLLVRKLFESEVAGLAAGFLFSLDGLLFTQSRIATPDTYVIFFILGCLYFLATRRLLLSGLFLGAAAACKWNGAFAVLPILLLFGWMAYNRWRDAGPDRRLFDAERVLAVGLLAVVVGVLLFPIAYVLLDGISRNVLLIGGIPAALGAFVVLGGVAAIASDPTLRKIPRGRVYIETAISLPVFFIAVPFAVYMASYIPMFLNGHGLDHWWYLNDEAYVFHSTLGEPHPYDSTLVSWPIDMRPVFLYLGGGYAKIYNLGNPMIFWMALPALAFTLWQGFRYVRARVDDHGRLAVWGRIGQEQAMCILVVVSYLGTWLALAPQSRALFLYHYIPALSFAIMALGYTVHRLWYHPSVWGKRVAIAFLAVAFATFVYFYPHWAAVDVPAWFDETYYWFDSWR